MRQRLRHALAAAALAGVAGVAAAAPAHAPKLDAGAEQVLRRVTGVLADLRGFSAKLHAVLRLPGVEGAPALASDYVLAVRRPDHLALILERGAVGATVVADGSKLHVLVPMLGRYTVADAPAGLDGLLEASGADMAVGGSGGVALLDALLARDPRAALMEDVIGGRYVGQETCDGVPCHRLAFSQPGARWELWVDAGPRPLVRRVVVRSAGEAESETILAFSDWVLDAPEDDLFRFEPTAGAQRVDSLIDEPEDEGAPALASQALGRPAPPFSLGLLGGGLATLATHQGKDVVVLDFWATWCAPCTRSLPQLAKVAQAYKDRGVVVYAVDQQEDARTVARFLKDRNVSLNVAMDERGRVGHLYGIDGIPQTLVIDRDGVVQAVHVGLGPTFGARLGSELDAVLEGRTLARARPPKAAALRGLERAWSIAGPWKGVAADPAAGEVYAVSSAGQGFVAGADGLRKRDLKIEGGGTLLRVAHLVGGARLALLSFDSPTNAVTAADTEGHLLWSHAGGQTVEDVWGADLDGDGLDEVVVGSDGGTSLHVLDAKGRILWTHDGLGNVGHVCAGDVDGDGKPEVVATSAKGQVHVFAGDGKKLRELDVRCHARMVRVAGGSGRDTLLVSGTGEASEILAAIDADGRWRWRLDLEPGTQAHADSAEAAPGRPWLALAMGGGRLDVVDVDGGKILGQIEGRGRRTEVAWLARPGGEPPLLLVADGQELAAYRITEK